MLNAFRQLFNDLFLKKPTVFLGSGKLYFVSGRIRNIGENRCKGRQREWVYEIRWKKWVYEIWGVWEMIKGVSVWDMNEMSEWVWGVRGKEINVWVCEMGGKNWVREDVGSKSVSVGWWTEWVRERWGKEWLSERWWREKVSRRLWREWGSERSCRE